MAGPLCRRGEARVLRHHAERPAFRLLAVEQDLHLPDARLGQAAGQVQLAAHETAAAPAERVATEADETGGTSIPAARTAGILEPRWMWSHDAVRPGDALLLALMFVVQPGWHVYAPGAGDLTALDVSHPVMESIYRISHEKMNSVDAGQSVTVDDVVKDLVRCGYVKAAEGKFELGVANYPLFGDKPRALAVSLRPE